MYQQPAMSPTLLTKALLRAAEQLHLIEDLPQLLQISTVETSQLQAGSRLLDSRQPEWVSALKLVGMFRTLIELLNTPERAKAWLGTPNDALGAKPIDLLRSSDAELVHRYLSAVRKHELRMPPAWRREH
jgi:hypothetical protein